MENNIVISFIIPAHNSEKFLKRCVESVVKEEKQSKDNNLAEVIIIENGSSDHTKQIGTALAEKYENVFLICSEKGVSNARNAGVKAAHGEWIFFLDADDYLPAGTLQKLLDTVNSGKAADLYIFSYEKGNAIVNVATGENAYGYEGTGVRECLAEEGSDLCHRFVMHGRAVCNARKPECEKCCLRDICRYAMMYNKRRK